MIYLDHAATRTVLPEVTEAMLPWLGVPANPSSPHRAGQRAAAAVERARAQVAALVGGDPAGVVFTSGATEANHLYLRGAFQLRSGTLAVSQVEHPCVHAAADVLGRRGVGVRRLAVDADGVVQLPAVLDPDTVVLSLLAVQHEVGVVQPVQHAAELADAAGAWLHVDATQAAGRLDLHGLSAHGLTLSGHKIGGPPGIGALVLRDGASFPALLPGAQERGRRGGTVPTALVVGFGVAAELAAARREAAQAHARVLRDRLEPALRALGSIVLAERAERCPSITAFRCPGVPGEALVQALDLHGVCVSPGAACASGSAVASPTLLAMGDPEPRGIVRVSTGFDTTIGEVEALLATLDKVIPAARHAAAWDG